MSTQLRTPFFLGIVSLTLVSSAPGDDWPQWRGPSRTGLSRETGLLQQWPEEGPPQVWRSEQAGVGYSSVAVASGRVITQGDIDGVEHVLAFSEKDGTLLWAVVPEAARASLAQRVAEQMKRLDRDGDGAVSDVEAIQGLGRGFAAADSASDGDAQTIARNRVQKLLEAFDNDDSGSLDILEAPAALMENSIDTASRDADREALATERAETIFAALDKDKDGQLRRAEIRNTVLQRLSGRMDERPRGERRGDGVITRQEAIKYFSVREQGKDGVLSEEELVSFFARRHPGRDGVLEREDLERHFGGYRNGQGDGPRGTPTIDGDRVYTVGGLGDVSCLDIETGETIWHVHLVDSLGGGRPGWGYSESPLVEGELLIVTPGGTRGCVAALDKTSGGVIWRSDDVPDNAHYSSAIAADVAGSRQIIQFTRERVVGLDAVTGDLLWEYANSANGTANCATPVYRDGHVFSSSAYGTGGGLVKVTRQGDGFLAEEVYFEDKMANHHGGLVLVGDHLYAFGGNSLICMNFLTGEIAWQDRSVGKGSLTYADGQLYCLGERNVVGLVAVDPAAYTETGRFRIESTGRPSWAHPVVANGRLYIRDQGTLTCYDVAR